MAYGRLRKAGRGLGMRRYVSRRAWLIYPRGSQLTASSLRLCLFMVCVRVCDGEEEEWRQELWSGEDHPKGEE